MTYIRRIVKGRSHAEITRLVNERFSVDKTRKQIVALIKNHGLSTGRTGRFEKGHTPANKGRKGWHPPGCETGWFPKGNVAFNNVPIGTEKQREDGYVYVKIQDGHKNANWKQKHIVAWEQVNGPCAPGECLVFVDGDTTNCDIDNLILIDRGLLATLNKEDLLGLANTREAVEAAILVARVKQSVSQAKKRQRKR